MSDAKSCYDDDLPIARTRTTTPTGAQHRTAARKTPTVPSGRLKPPVPQRRTLRPDAGTANWVTGPLACCQSVQKPRTELMSAFVGRDRQIGRVHRRLKNREIESC